MPLYKIAFSIGLALVSMRAVADANELSGTWKHYKSAVYATKTGILPPVEYRTLQFVNGVVALRPACDIVTDYSKETYRYNNFFQMALKSGVDENSMAEFVKKQFNFDLIAAKNFYAGNKLTRYCATGFNRAFVTKDKLIFAGSGGSFDAYERTDGGTQRAPDPAVNLYGRKLSHLPYRSSNFTLLCKDALPRVNYTPQNTDKCAPVMYPYVAIKSDIDPLARTIGAHTYKKNGAEAEKDYDNPVSHNLHPVYMVLPPLKDIVVVAVEDVEFGDSRPGMAGVFLSIRNNKVIDQITADCSLNEDYSCVAGDGKKKYQLLNTGKFQKSGE
jgi:hypothetical protein